MYHQATWDEPLIIEKSQAGKRGHIPTGPSDIERKIAGDLGDVVPSILRRNGLPPLPEVSEPEVIRHYVRLSQENYSPDLGIYPLGSCTMKYNPKSAEVTVVPSNMEGMVDLDELRKLAGPNTAGLMITNPNTLGIFEKNILEIAKIVHEAGGLLYYDGANFNPLLGKVRPGDMGFDIVHLNLHKTFATPHGGGGPGAGPVGVTKELERYLPVPLIGFDGKKYFYDYNVPGTVGKIRAFHGNIGILVRAYVYIMSLGAEGLKTVAETAVLNTNYILSRILASGTYDLPFARARKHEFVLSAKKLYDSTGVRAMDLAKRMLDKGVHAPTTYFPQIVDEALMVEVPETESLADLDQLVEALLGVYREAQTNPEVVKDAPHYTSVTRIDDVKASHPKTLTLHWSNPSVLKNREVSNEEMSSQESKSELTSPPSR